MRHIDYEVFVRMMNRWTDEDQARLAQAKARHDLKACAFVNAITKCTPMQGDVSGVDPHLAYVAKAWRTAGPWTDVGRYATRGPRGSATQRLYVDGARCGEAYVVVDEVSGEIEERNPS